MLLIATVCIVSCRKAGDSDRSEGQFSNSTEESDRIAEEEKVCRYLKQFAAADTDSSYLDRFVKRYYLDGNRVLWLTRKGVRLGANSLANQISKVEDAGFGKEKFYASLIKKDLKSAKRIDLEHRTDSANRLLAHLEYYLTKSYIRYCIGMRFGFVRPSRILNRLDVDDSDTANVKYIRLFDIPIRQPKQRDYAEAMRKIAADSVKYYMIKSAPTSKLYAELKKKCREAMSFAERKRLLCNMERCRWRLLESPSDYEKYVIVNLPSQHLAAVDGENVISMRIGCGANKTKTPLLTSKITRLDFNPQWVLPSSIVKKSILQHIGDNAFFERNNYYVQERKTGSPVDIGKVTAEMLCSGDYRVIQRGGEGNALGRVIFRFDNNFSVFLHDTSSPSVFERGDRLVSHGCVRVERPFDLAVFMLADKDDETVDRIDHTMNEWHSSPAGKNDENSGSDRAQRDTKRYIKSLKVSPPVPLFITYYTLYPDADNVLCAYKDIYGYDDAIYAQLKQFSQ